MMLAAVLLVMVLATVCRPRYAGAAEMPTAAHAAGLTFCGLALVQVLSYPFHDPVHDRPRLYHPARDDA